MFHDAAVLLYAITAGFTTSGIVANLYRIAAEPRKGQADRTLYYISLVIAGPSVLLENAAKAWRERNCTWIAFWLATAVAGYWSLALGLFVIEVALAI